MVRYRYTLKGNVTNVIEIIILVLSGALEPLKTGWEADNTVVGAVLLQQYMQNVGAHIAVHSGVAGQFRGYTYTIKHLLGR